MNSKQALAKLQKILGPRAAYRTIQSAPDAAERDEARALAKERGRERAEAKEAMEARRALLLQDPEYRALVAKYQALNTEATELFSRSCSYRIRAGKNMGLFFEVLAEGDTWDEVFEKLKAKTGSKP